MSLSGSLHSGNLAQAAQSDPGAISVETDFSFQAFRPVNLPPVPLANEPQLKSAAERERDYARIGELKTVLADGATLKRGDDVWPFVFLHGGTPVLVAQSAGLEGFIDGEKKLVSRFGREASVALIENYLKYSSDLLAGHPWAREVRESIRELRSNAANPSEKYQKFIGLLTDFVDAARQELATLDQAAWIREAKIYQVLAPQFNLAGRREALGIESSEMTGRLLADLNGADYAQLRALGINTIRLTGLFPIGEIGRLGSEGAGSLFSIKKHEVDPSFGSVDEVREAVKVAARNGMRVVFEAILNHTSMDSDLLRQDPSMFVHTTTEPTDKSGYFHYVHPEKGEFWLRLAGYHHDDYNRREYWSDVIQLDLSNPDTRKALINQVREMVVQYGVQSFRVDMAYQLLNDYLQMNWNGELQRTLPKREFLEELITTIKSEFPSVAFVAEGYGGWEKLSQAGFDVIYGFNGMLGVGGHHHQGWYGALKDRDPTKIRNAIERVEFLSNQTGGAEMLTFIGNHDLPSPIKAFNDWAWGATFLTFMKSGPFLFLGGTGAGFEAEDPVDQKMISFRFPVQIDWSGMTTSFGKYVHQTFLKAQHLRTVVGETEMVSIDHAGSRNEWVGYGLIAKGDPERKIQALVLANPKPYPVEVKIDRPDLGVTGIKIPLSACGPDGQELFFL